MADRLRRASLGFQGGQSLSLKLTAAQLQNLQHALAQGEPGWREVDTSDGALTFDSRQVVYLTVATDEQHVGF